MPLAEAPAIEDEIVAASPAPAPVERAPRRGRQDDVVERPARDNRLDRAAAGRAEQTVNQNRRHASTVPPVTGCKQQDRAATRGCLLASASASKVVTMPHSRSSILPAIVYALWVANGTSSLAAGSAQADPSRGQLDHLLVGNYRLPNGGRRKATTGPRTAWPPRGPCAVPPPCVADRSRACRAEYATPPSADPHPPYRTRTRRADA